MTPPEAPQHGSNATAGERPPAVSFCVETLRKRSDFLAASRAAHTATSGFVLQMRRRTSDEPPEEKTVRVGFTCSKKVGNAVARNCAKRRLREIARLTLPDHAEPGTDYVLIGRRDKTATMNFAAMQADLVRALAKLHARAK